MSNRLMCGDSEHCYGLLVGPGDIIVDKHMANSNTDSVLI